VSVRSGLDMRRKKFAAVEYRRWQRVIRGAVSDRLFL